MIRFACVVCFAFAGNWLCIRDGLAADPPLTGKWQVSSAVRYGKEAGGDVGIIYEFLPGGDLVIRFPGGRNLKGTYKLDREPDPDHIDIETDEDRPDVGGGGPRLGIFMVKEDKLVFCINGAAKKPRPLKPESKAGQLTILLEMKREVK